MITRSYFSGIFGSSPFRALQEHMSKVVDCTEELGPLFDALSRQDYEGVAAAQHAISKLEDQADDLKKELRLHLPNRLFLPVDRRDLLELLRVQDYIANTAKDIAGVVLGRRMVLPPALLEPFQAYVQRSIDAARQAHRTVEELDELVGAGFRGAEMELVEELLDELDRIEKETDLMQIDLRSQLRELEADLFPVDVMFLYKVIEQVGAIADLAQRAGSRLQMMLAS